MRMSEVVEEPCIANTIGACVGFSPCRVQRVLSNYLFYLTAARVRFGMNPNGCGGAAGDQQR